MEDVLWWWFSRCVNIPGSEISKIRRQYGSVRECKQAMIPHLISTHPSLSWTLIAHALYQMVIHLYLSDDDDLVSCHNSLDLLQQKFPTGNTYCIQQQYGPTPREAFPRAGVGAYGLLNITNVFPLPA